MTLIDGLVALILLAGLVENRFPAIPVAAMGVVGLRGLTSRVIRGLGFSTLEWSVVGMLGYWLASYFWSTADLHNLVAYEFLRRDGAPLVTYPTFIFLLGWQLKSKSLVRFWLVFLLAVAVLAFTGSSMTLHVPYLDLWFAHLGLAFYDPMMQQTMFFGWYHAHNTAGGIFALFALLALTFIQVGRRSGKSKTVIWGMFLICLLGLLLTYSRTGFMGLMFGALVIIPIRQLGKVFRAALIFALPLLVIVMMESPLLNHLDTITDPTYRTNADRFNIWGEAFHFIEMSPLIGIGFGRFNDGELDFKGEKGLVYVAVGGLIQNNDYNAHNSTLQFLAEGGIVGLFLSMEIWWFAWKELSAFERRLPKSRLFVLFRASKAWIVAVIVMSMFEHMLGRGTVVLALMSMVGLTIASARAEWRSILTLREEEEKQKMVRKFRRRAEFSPFNPGVGAAR